jgi:hypothetical protein
MDNQSETVSIALLNVTATSGLRHVGRCLNQLLVNSFAAASGRDPGSADHIVTKTLPQPIGCNKRTPNMHEWYEATRRPEGGYDIKRFHDDLLLVTRFGGAEVTVATHEATVADKESAIKLLQDKESHSKMALEKNNIPQGLVVSPWNHFSRA